jgi:hypothetical protein
LPDSSYICSINSVKRPCRQKREFKNKKKLDNSLPTA